MVEALLFEDSSGVHRIVVVSDCTDKGIRRIEKAAEAAGWYAVDGHASTDTVENIVAMFDEEREEAERCAQ